MINHDERVAQTWDRMAVLDRRLMFFHGTIRKDLTILAGKVLWESAYDPSKPLTDKSVKEIAKMLRTWADAKFSDLPEDVRKFLASSWRFSP